VAPPPPRPPSRSCCSACEARKARSGDARNAERAEARAPGPRRAGALALARSACRRRGAPLARLLIGQRLASRSSRGGGRPAAVVGQGAGGTSYSVPIQTLLFFTALSFLPAVLLLMTASRASSSCCRCCARRWARRPRRPTR
jgi:hypothetical protein